MKDILSSIELPIERPPGIRYTKSIDIWINAALRKMGREDKVGQIVWCVNEDLGFAETPRAPGLCPGLDIAPVVARSKFLVVFKEFIFLNLEFSPLFFENTTGQAQRREIVYHEVAHVVDSFSGDYDGGHGKNWKRLMVNAGCRPKTSYVLKRK